MLIGIAGKTGAGKNFIADLLKERGWRVLDLDAVGHRVLDVHAEDIETAFGPGLLKDGVIDRRQLGRIVFAQSAALMRLEKLTYPWIEEETRKWIEEHPERPAAIHAVNLHKTQLMKKLNALIWVWAPVWVRKRRVMERDGQSWKDLKGRFRAQRRLSPKLFSSYAEIYNVRNSKKRAVLERRLDRILDRLLFGGD